jgi:hypothetical protein
MPTLEIKDLRVRSLDVYRHEVTWELGGYEEPWDYSMRILRSESPEGPYEALTPPFEDRYLFVDSNLPVGDPYRQLWYRLEVTNKREAAEQQSDYVPVLTDPASLQAEPDLIANYIRFNEAVLFTQVIGRKCWLFKARTFGPRCPCFDRTTGKKLRTGCLTCYDTGFLRGFHDPIEVWAQIDPASKVTERNGNMEIRLGNTKARMPYYPPIVPDDILVELENKRWRVVTTVQTERLRAVCRQEMELTPVPMTDIQFRLPLNLDRALRDVQASPVRMFSNATSMTEARETDIPDLYANYPTYPKDPSR